MGKAAARSGDKLVVKGTLDHKYKVDSTPPVTTPYTCDFSGTIANGVSADVSIGTAAAAIKNDASESGAHTAAIAAQGGSWLSVPKDNTPKNSAKVTGGSASVFINGKPAVRDGDGADTCDTNGAVEVQNAGSATVFIGD
jgi:uncharacterized Zn-binding protein involved in type VI secretion